MPFALDKEGSEWTLTLSGVVDVFDAAALHIAAIEAAEAAPAGVVVRMSSVEAIDGSITQVLLALRRALVAAGKVFRLEGVPAPVAERWRLAGLEDELA
jgi:anti-anti-sigma regulatory factor